MFANRLFIKKYIYLSLFLFAMVLLPPFFVEKLRAKIVLSSSPLWKGFYRIKAPFSSKHEKLSTSFKKLEIENHLLKNELLKLRKALDQSGIYETEKKEIRVVTSRVIFRDPGSCESSFWIDAGEETNAILGKKILVKNSPVLYGKCVIGVLDHVGKKQSKVRLITDSGCKISVRVARGSYQNAFLVEQIGALIRALTTRGDLSITLQERRDLIGKLDPMMKSLQDSSEGWKLAKGVIQGSGTPLWRKKDILKGIGFNFDFDDSEGKARDLQTGALLQGGKDTAIPLIKLNDLLVTTGMDGIFPSGLIVGEVTRIFPLKEGGYAYDIEAMPAAHEIDDMKMVFIIPPLSQEERK